MTIKYRNLSGNYTKPNKVLATVKCTCNKTQQVMTYPANKTRLRFIPDHKQCKHDYKIKTDKERHLKNIGLMADLPDPCTIELCKQCKYRQVLRNGILRNRTKPCQLATFEPITNSYDYDIVDTMSNEVEVMTVG